MSEPIVIVGRGCVLPGAFDPAALWDIVAHGRVMIDEGSRADYGCDANPILSPAGRFEPDKIWHTRGAYIRGFERVWNPAGFAIPAERLRVLDRIFQWPVHAAAAALREAGGASDAERARAAVILGSIAQPTYGHLDWAASVAGLTAPDADSAHPWNRYTGGLPAIVAAQALGLRADRSFTLDAACASGLIALKHACDLLQSGEVDLALAGGINAADALQQRLVFCAFNAYSRAGRSRPFATAADGLVPGEGCVVLALRRLSDAQRRGDRILALVRGVQATNDGRGAGLLAPSEDGQVRAIAQAWREAALDPALLSLAECHATGTPLGDGQEIRSSLRAWGAIRGVTLSSHKANFGHLITAAGALGALKVLGCFEHATLPPTPGVDSLIPEAQHPELRLLDGSAPWTPREGRRVATVSAFGFGGNNAHLVLESWDGSPEQRDATAPTPQRPPAAPEPLPELAIVALAVRTHQARDTTAFAAQLFAETAATAEPLAALELSPAECAFPPKDLQRATGAQLLALATAQEALAQVPNLPRAETAVFLGQSPDTRLARAGLRLRWHQWHSDSNAPERDTMHPPMDVACVSGGLPNFPANRINNACDLRGSGHMVWAEELSGDIALQLAARALVRGECSAAVVGAVEFAREKIHTEAEQAILPDEAFEPAEVAVMFVVKTAAAAHAAGDRVLAFVRPGVSDTPVLALENAPGRRWLGRWCGHAHAASGLLHLAAATLMASQRCWLPAPGAGARLLLPAGNAVDFTVQTRSFIGTEATWSVRAGTGPALDTVGARVRPHLRLFAAADVASLRQAIEQDRPTPAGGPCRLGWLEYPETRDAQRRDALALLAASFARGEGRTPGGVVWRAAPLGGQLAFVFTGAAAAYPRNGEGLALAWPGLVAETARLAPAQRNSFAVVFSDDSAVQRLPHTQSAASGYLCQLHGRFSQTVLGLKPEIVFGLSSGETNALPALGVWAADPPLISLPGVRELYFEELGGKFDAVRRHWGLAPDERVSWENWVVRATAADVREALQGETRCYLSIIAAPGECVIGGDAAACARVLARLRPAAPPVPLGHDLAVHCPVTSAWENEWRTLHTRACAPLPAGVRFYSNYFDAAYEPTPERAADALTGQALVPIDFPRMVERVYADGARIFLEHGPRGGCTAAIKATLGSRPHVAVSLDLAGRDAAEQAAVAALELWCAGVPVRLDSFLPSAPPPTSAGPRLRFPLRLPDLPTCRPPRGRVLPPAPALAPISAWPITSPPTNTPAASIAPAAAPQLVASVPATSPSPLLWWHAQLTSAHAHLVAHQQAAWQAFEHYSAQIQHTLLAAPRTARPQHRSHAPIVSTPALQPPRLATAPTAVPAEVSAVAPIDRAPSAAVELVPAETTHALDLDRAACFVLAEGRQADVLGEEFAFLDNYTVQVRLPRAPYMFCDRLHRFKGTPLKFVPCSLVSEYRVRPGEWYLHAGRMLMGPFWETMQADLTLAAWMGIDRQNRGRRRYRLLSGEFTMHGPLPRAGDHIRVEISSDNVRRQGEMHLFYFRDRLTVNGRLVITVEKGVAGFFTNEELASSEGVIWDPAKAKYRDDAAPYPINKHTTRKTRFTSAEVAAFSHGDAAACFGPELALTAAHFRTPAIPPGRTRMMDEVLTFDPRGGPKGRGHARARLHISPDKWYYYCHFMDDPCLPGTMMVEGAVQVLSFYLTAVGLTVPRDGWRFEPVWPCHHSFLFRAQAAPQHRTMDYEVFVDEITDGAEPSIRAHVLFHVDNKPAVLMEHFSVRLVPDWPANDLDALLDTPVADHRPVVHIGEFVCDRVAMLNFGLGQPSRMMGHVLARGDPLFRGPARLPTPPYLFLTRALSVEGQPTVPRPGTKCEIAHDLAPDTWYFGDYGQGTMPVAALMEALLQPAGWLTTFVVPPEADIELKVRNLDGTIKLHRHIRPSDRTLRSEVRLLSHSNFGGTNLQKFSIVQWSGDEKIGECETVFGFFPDSALEQQVGLPTDPAELTRVNAPSDFACDLLDEPARYYGGQLRLARGRLKLVDRITAFVPDGGTRGRGYIRAMRRIDPGEWVFRAHFFRDPVQPGSMGCDALTQLFNWYLLHTGRAEGFASPVFEPLLTAEVFEWHYRGQVTQDAGEIVLDADIHEEGRDEHGYFIRGEARLWVGGKKIYHLARVGVRIVEGTPVPRRLASYDTSPHLPLTLPDGRLDVAAILGWWRRTLAGDGGAIAEVTGALFSRFVRRVIVEDPHDLAAWRGRPVLFLANHQVGVETLLFSILAAALGETPVASIAKRELGGSWPDFILELFGEEFRAAPPADVLYFDREDRESLPRLLADYVAQLTTRPRSLMLHVEGTRATQANQPVARMSAVFVDLAVKAQLPIVPVRFIGGLPVEPDNTKREYPVGAGAQDYIFGRAISPAELAALPYAERAKHVLAAINRLGPAPGAERPFKSDEELDTRIRDAVAKRGHREFPAMIDAVLQDWVEDQPLASPIATTLLRETRRALETGDANVANLPAARALARLMRGESLRR